MNIRQAKAELKMHGLSKNKIKSIIDSIAYLVNATSMDSELRAEWVALDEANAIEDGKDLD